MRKGVDISEWNGEVDFAAVKAAGAEFVIIRTGYGKDFPGQQDNCFERSVKEAEKHGLSWGVYHYGYAENRAMGKEEAEHALRLLKGRIPAYGVWYDMEDAETLNGDLAEAAKGFCETIRKAGLYAGVYANLNWWENYLTSPVFDQYDRWVAQYNSECEYSGPYGIWQYTDKWMIGGKNFDGNIAYKDYLKLTGKGDGEMTYDDFKAYMQRYEKEQAAKDASRWAEEAIDYCKEQEIMSGDANGSFRPQSFVKRQELAQVAMNLHKALKQE